MDIDTITSISAVIIPIALTIGLMVWAYKVGKRSAKKDQDIQLKARQLAQKDNEKELLDTLVEHKERHISLLRKMMGKE